MLYSFIPTIYLICLDPDITLTESPSVRNECLKLSIYSYMPIITIHLPKFSSQCHFTHPHGATNIIIILQNEQLDSCTSSLKYYHLLTYSVDNPYLEASTDDDENLFHQIFRHICD